MRKILVIGVMTALLIAFVSIQTPWRDPTPTWHELAQRWWLSTTHTTPPVPESLVATGWPTILEYFHEIEGFRERAQCESRRQAQLDRAAAITRTVGRHYEMAVSHCRHALIRGFDDGP